MDFHPFNPKSLLLACRNAITYASEEEKSQVAKEEATAASKTLVDALWKGKIEFNEASSSKVDSYHKATTHGHELFLAYIELFDLPYLSIEACQKVLSQYQDFLSWGSMAFSGKHFAKTCADWHNNKNSYWDKMESKVKSQYPEVAIRETTSNSGGCYVASAVYGSYDCPEVWTLRRYRDYDLAETWYGRAFIWTYYAVSPTIVKWFGKTHWFNSMWKPVLDRIVLSLKSRGYKDTPYDDKRW